jgi:hypothetical protein
MRNSWVSIARLDSAGQARYDHRDMPEPQLKKESEFGTCLSPAARLLLWDYERGSLLYDVVCVILILLLFLLPPHWLGDPMIPK